MNQAVFPIPNHAQIAKVTNYLNLNHAKAAVEGKPLIVTISTKQIDRSSAQNRLYWKWLTQFADHVGSTKEEQHTFFKRKFLISIFNRDDAEYAEMCTAIAALKKNECEEYKAIADHVIKLTSTSKASVKQMNEYLNQIEAFCLMHGAKLLIPYDLEWCYRDGL
ncbi:MAG: hypothetical protein BGN93_07835 [Acinetobacter sp. 39-4]|nr:MAG: hypothetical protein BGN93_07835 [Acinetobacter sp. 39-4]